MRGLPSQVKGAGFRVQSRRCSWVRIPSPAPTHIDFQFITPPEFSHRGQDSFSRAASRTIRMQKKRLDGKWDREIRTEDLKPALKRYSKYIEDEGLSKSTISSYVFRVGKFLEFSETDMPSIEKFSEFREILHEKKLSRSSINNYCFAIKRYFEMCGKTINFNFIRPMNTIPHFFDENDLAKIFAACSNLKHFAMLQTLFYASLLRANSATSMTQTPT